MSLPIYIRIFLGFILSIQILFALVIGPLLSKTDVFPLHQWALFAKINKVEQIPVLYVRRLDSQFFTPLRSYYKLIPQYGSVDFLVARDNLTTWHELIERNQQNEAALVLKDLISHLWPETTLVEYEIHLIEVDLIDFIQKESPGRLIKQFGPFTTTLDQKI